MPHYQQSLAVSLLLAGSLVWGLFWWPLKLLAEQGFPSSLIQLLAYSCAALAMLPTLWRQDRSLWRQHAGLLLLITLFGGWANASFASALTYGNVVRVMLLFYLAPVWTILAARLMLGEAITRLRLLSLSLALTGLALTLGGPQLFDTPLSAIDLLALSAGLAFALNNVTIRASFHLPESARIMAVFVGCIIFSALMLGWQDTTMPEASLLYWLALPALGLLWILPGTLATYFGVSRLPAGKAGILLLAELVVAIVAAVLINNEVLKLTEVLGAGLILAAGLLEALTEPQEETA